MKYPFLSLFVVSLLFFSSCQNSYRQVSPENSNSQGVVGVSDDAYQVTVEEYGDYFESRFGLLYQKFNDKPFTGRILTIDKGDNGDYVSADESWTEGKKDGLSARWFSNGIKMYERNYKEGRWHGTVTRWWPNGQKMYVRAYTNGSRHGKEATWRSDGSPIKLSDKPFINPVKVPSPTTATETKSVSEVPVQEANKFPAGSPIAPDNAQPFTQENEFGSPLAPSPIDEPALIAEDLPPVPEAPPSLDIPEISPAVDNIDDVPSLPGVDSSVSEGLPEIPESSNTGFPELPDSNAPPSDSFPEFPSSEGSLPPLPGVEPAGDLPAFPPSPSDEDALPPLPTAGSNDLPPLPGRPDEGNNLPPLPGFPSDDASGGLPPLPSDEPDGGLPPLPAFPE